MKGHDELTTVSGVRRVGYLALAAVFFVLGMVGAVLPGLPTTPFLLLTSYLLIRSWPWLHHRVVGIPIVGRSIHEWQENRGVRRHVKVIAYLMVAAVVAYSLFAETVYTPIKVAIVVLAAIGVTVVWRLPAIETRGGAGPHPVRPAQRHDARLEVEVPGDQALTVLARPTSDLRPDATADVTLIQSETIVSPVKEPK